MDGMGSEEDSHECKATLYQQKITNYSHLDYDFDTNLFCFDKMHVQDFSRLLGITYIHYQRADGM